MSNTATSTSSATRKTNFKPVHNPALSQVPDLFEWVIKQPKEFQAQLSTMPLEAFMKTQFKTYCPHCMLDHKCMSIFGRPSATTQGLCIQCLHFLATGKRSTLQH